MAAQGGPAVDLRDDGNVRSIFFSMLVDWSGSDLKNVYEPFSDQIGYFITAFLLVVATGAVYGLYTKWKRKRKERTIPYKVIQPPKYLAEEREGDEKEKRVIAVLGSTGFIGSHIAETLIKTGRYRVYLLGRHFTPHKILPGADAVFQVDMMDYQGLVNSLKGVDSVINSAVVVPTVFTSDDDLWRLNVTGAENILAASKEAGVKNFVLIGGLGVENIRNSTLRVIVNALTTIQRYVLDSNELNACVIRLSQIYGIRSPFWDLLLSGEMTSFPKVEQRATFTPVEFAADAIMRAEAKLAESDHQVVGKTLKIGGYPSTFKEVVNLKEWGRTIKNMPVWVLRILGNINLVVSRVTGWAPLGALLSPAMCSFFDVKEEEVDNGVVEEALGIGSVPPVREGVAKMVARFNEEKDK